MRQVRRRKGFTLLTTAICIVVIMGMLGLVIDLGRSYIAKNETQAFTDAAALAAAAELDDTSAGINNAKYAVTNSANKWYFNSKSFSGVTTEFSTDQATWVTSPTTGTNYRYARVTAPTNSLTTYFMTALGAPATMNVAARSVAGIKLPTSFPQGVFPFSPIAHDTTGPDFGYVKGNELTLLWPSSVESNGGVETPQKKQNLCQSDQTEEYLAMVKDGSGAERGYIMETSASAIAAAIEDDKMSYTVSVGGTVTLTGGVKTTDVYQSLEDRISQDSEPNQKNYDAYIANHDASPMRRIVIVPIVENLNTTSTPIVLGFVKVFLPPNQPHSPNKSKCAEYIGPADTPSGNSANGDNMLRLLE